MLLLEGKEKVKALKHANDNEFIMLD
jgi:hypothetical protein